MKIFNLLFGFTPIPGNWPNIAILLLRIYVGFTMMWVGLDKLPMPEWMVEQVASINFPFPRFFSWMACWSEFGCGLLLLLGLATRFSSFMILVTMAVASFAFQEVYPFVDMHIAQHYVWSAFLFLIIGGGKYSHDYLLAKKNVAGVISYLGILIVLIAGLMIEYFAEPELEAGDMPNIQSVNIAGTFNNWDPASNEMVDLGAGIYQIDVNIEKEGPIQFKFTANKSWDLNVGEEDQDNKGFPLSGTGELDEGGNTQNIQGFIPVAGTYRFTFNMVDYSYQVDTIP